MTFYKDGVKYQINVKVEENDPITPLEKQMWINHAEGKFKYVKDGIIHEIGGGTGGGHGAAQ